MLGFYKKSLLIIAVCCAVVTAPGCNAEQSDNELEKETAATATAEAATPEPTASTEAPATERSADLPDFAQLVVIYGGLGLVDAHNHDASGKQYQRMEESWSRYKVRNIVLFGDASDHSAIMTDFFSWDAYQSNLDLYIPYFLGFDLHDPECVNVIKDNLEKGYSVWAR
ncbi:MULTISPECIES: hypothetical protein [unclassified Paenibacillus]|uniref:hypothetical protein n=1 Tax=unclassified Paenibacillus TaxID=185978 RepID=UPI00240602EE|nr:MULTISPECIES: hypothetical protein [unclassified Paenibacillus]MDF9839041.1 hypothetical protein [Paenibacillus sp. PastF-2]MDF9845623.1 hypothetical protein [Paenibacillus sp. PastM-2]MDF9852195.1 hypothetical protein [Paenibacillus sp. PastF-1]MDH6478076.1 hypothetical protein [Paenibacillus sp. PastH-2]MDH6505810.1 hypothetical protein [Paenibacillus sp. PastM-3]